MDDELLEEIFDEDGGNEDDFDGLRFETYEHEPIERTSDWYWTVGIFTLAICVISIIYGNVLFAILVLVSAFTLLLMAAKPPRLVVVELTPKGIKNHHRNYPHRTLDGFWVEEESHKNTLLFQPTKKFTHLVAIPLGDVDPDIIRDYLSNFLPEIELHEPLGQKVMERLGF